jgi:sugar/nucleoside kinase (ribokinase family)
VAGAGIVNPFDVMVAGDLFVDLIMSDFDAWPEPGTEVRAKGFHREVGGGAAITACGLAKLGSRTAVFGVVGEDTGEWVAKRLQSCGVITSGLRFDPLEPTAISVAVSTPEDRAFLTYMGANVRLPALLDRAEFGSARHIHLATPPDLERGRDLLEAIRREGCTVSLDVGWHEDWLADPRAMKFLELVDVFFPNEREAQRMTGERDGERCLRAFEKAGAKDVAMKAGRNGAMLLSNREILREGAVAVKSIDTTGAGDCFDAGFLHFWLKRESPAICLRAGAICGAASTEAYGGINGFPKLERVERELRNACAK